MPTAVSERAQLYALTVAGAIHDQILFLARRYSPRIFSRLFKAYYTIRYARALPNTIRFSAQQRMMVERCSVMTPFTKL